MNKITSKETLIEKSIRVFGNKFDFTNTIYQGTKKKLTFICKTCGSSITNRVDAHFASKYGCPTCAKHLRIEKETAVFAKQFQVKAKAKHKGFYTYDKVEYVNNHTKVTITCPTHGDFLQEPGNHVYGFGCEKCGREKTNAFHEVQAIGLGYAEWEKACKNSKNFDSYKLYVIECSGNGEKFTKIGRTFKETYDRFRKSRIPYEWTLVKEIVGDARFICELEEELKRNLLAAGAKYTPLLAFDGMTECYKITVVGAMKAADDVIEAEVE